MKAFAPSLRRAFVSTSLFAVLVACGGGGGGGIQSDDSSLLSGVLLDSAVSGVQYDDALTGLDGRFFYLQGDTLRFQLGGIDLGNVTGRAQITPHDLAGSHDDYLHDKVVRIARLLQSLDSNGVLSDGIQISDAVRNAASGRSLDWQAGSADFERALSDLVFTLTSGQRSVVSADAAQAHLQDTLSNTVEACSALPRNADQFQINNPRCLDRARVAAWLETVKPREQALDAVINSLASGGAAQSALDQMIALVPLDMSGVVEADLIQLAQWVSERVAGDDSALRARLGEFLGVRYASRVFGEQPCAEPCSVPTVASVVQGLETMRNRTVASQWQRTLDEARVARDVLESWLGYGFDRAALLGALGVESLRDRTPLLRASGRSLGLANSAYRVDVVDNWVARQLALNDVALTARGSFDGGGLADDPSDGNARVSEVSYGDLVVGQSVVFRVQGENLGASLVLQLDGCVSTLISGGDASARDFRCTLSGEAGWRTLVINDGLTDQALYRLSVFVKPAGDDSTGNGSTDNDSNGNDNSDDTPTTPPSSDSTPVTVTSVTPVSATIGQQTDFTLVGQGFTERTTVAIASCTNASVISRSAARIQFSCVPSGSSGNRVLTVAQDTFSDNSLRVRFDAAGPSVSGVSPATATAGELTRFTVSGSNLNSALTFVLQDCSGVVAQSGGTALSQVFQCTPSSAGSKAGSIANGGIAVHQFSVSVSPGLDPVVTSVSPENGVMSAPLTLTVKGSDLPNDLAVQLANCSAPVAQSRSAIEQVFTCQPSSAGLLSGTVVADGETLSRFSVDVRDDRVVISEVRPGATRLGAITTFTVSGVSLPTSLTLDIDNCDDFQPLGGSSTRRQFRCTPTGSLGTRDVDVLFDSESTSPLHTHTLTVAGDGPLVTNVSPVLATAGRSTTFTVVGQSLSSILSFRMEGCAVSTVGQSTSSVHRFRCTVSGAAGPREATVVDTRTGAVLYTFDVSVSAGT